MNRYLASLIVWSMPSLMLAQSAPRPDRLIRPGVPWYDTAGQPIDAHGGGLLHHEGRYYWYGEMKAGPTELPASNASWYGTRVAYRGISCYSSTDLVSWTIEGNVLPSDPTRPELQADRVVERPKVIFNAHTREFVMWVHIDSADYKEARTGVAVSDRPTGPFRLLQSLRPDAGVFPLDMPETLRTSFQDAVAADTLPAWQKQNPDWGIWARDFAGGQMARDQGLLLDDDGKAYHFYASEENNVLHVSELSPTYREHAGRYRRITFDSREAPAPFKWKGRYYLISSGCTGWDPNPSHLHSADHPLSAWTDHGDIFLIKSTATSVSHLSQPTYVLAGPESRLMLLADRWEKLDLEASSYIWLPLVEKGGLPRARWAPRWSLDAP